MSARHLLNLVYGAMIENMEEDERERFIEDMENPRQQEKAKRRDLVLVMGGEIA